VRQKFTAKERDNETGLDYFLARYYSSTQGRFTSPDEFTGGPDELYYFADDAAANPTFYADLRKPQSLNKYQYALENPLRFIDPDGHTPCCMTDEDVKNLNEGASNVVTAIAKEAANAFIGMGNVTRHFQGQEPVELYKPDNKTQAVVMVVTGDVALFAGALGGKPQVGGVLVAETRTASQVAALTVANEAQTLSGAARPGAAGALVSTTGQTVTATTRSGSINAGVQAVLDRVPASQRSAYHGKCCEPRLISQAQDAGINLRGAQLSVVKVRAPGNPAHGATLAPCSSCRAVLKFAGID
jgi:RHS repeat-associated protein